jgi:hypothetical protein
MSSALVKATAVNPAFATAPPWTGCVICPAVVGGWTVPEAPSSKCMARMWSVLQ